jgi:RecA/RadA recombinase
MSQTLRKLAGIISKTGTLVISTSQFFIESTMATPNGVAFSVLI